MTDSPPTFTGVHLFVRDMAATVAFYRAIGLTVDEHDELSRATSAGSAELVFGSYELTLRYDPAFVPSTGSAVALQIALASREAVDNMHARLIAAGYATNLAPFDAFWGARYAEVRDPDGVVVGFQSPRDDSRRSAPPSV